jgi:hypothetical protein
MNSRARKDRDNVVPKLLQGLTPEVSYADVFASRATTSS